MARLIFDESTLEQNAKSLVYYCKYFLRDELSSFKQHVPVPQLTNMVNMDLIDSLKPISAKLFYEIARAEELRAAQLALVRPPLHQFEAIKMIRIEASRSGSIYSTASSSNIRQQQQQMANESNILIKKKVKKTIFPIFFQTT